MITKWQLHVIFVAIACLRFCTIYVCLRFISNDLRMVTSCTSAKKSGTSLFTYTQTHINALREYYTTLLVGCRVTSAAPQLDIKVSGITVIFFDSHSFLLPSVPPSKPSPKESNHPQAEQLPHLSLYTLTTALVCN